MKVLRLFFIVTLTWLTNDAIIDPIRLLLGIIDSAIAIIDYCIVSMIWYLIVILIDWLFCDYWYLMWLPLFMTC